MRIPFWKPLWCLLCILTPHHSTAQEEVDYASELPRIPPTAPDDALNTFIVDGNFKMELVASEPLIGSPVAIEWDPSGAMFVCEMRGYSENRDDAISGIARLTDQDGDGVYDRRTQYVSNLLWPTGIFPYQGGLFVGDAPHLWYFKDLDGDGIADLKQLILTGFGTSNVQGLLNSFRWGLDNRIHIACSSSGGKIQAAHAGSTQAPIPLRGRDIALDPRTFTIIPTSGAAQHGMCFDDSGNKFVSSNSDHIQQVMYEDRYVAANPYSIPLPSRISIAADGPQAEVFRQSPVEPWRLVRTRLRVAGKAKGPIEGGGRASGYFTGSTGVTIYRGDAWPSNWKGTAIVGDVGSNLIHRKEISKNGLQFIANRIDQNSEFVASADTWFRPAQFANAPDGSLYVIDVYREVIEHPKSLPIEIKRHLDLTAGRNRGRIYRIVPKQHTPSKRHYLSEADTTELAETLSHKNAWHRETAARLLYERQDSSAVPLLRQMVKSSSSPIARLQALYALSGLSDSLDARILVDSLQDRDPNVRRHAIRLSEAYSTHKEIRSTLLQMVDDPSVEVRFQLAFSAAFLPSQDRLRVLERLLRQNHLNRWMCFAVLTSSAKVGMAFKRSLQTSPSDAETYSDFLKLLEKQIVAVETSGESANVKIASVASRQVVETSRGPNRSRANAESRAKIVSEYRRALTMSPDVSRGAEHYRKHCAGCHQFGKLGHPIGPHLATMKSRGAETLLTSILDPNREVNPMYHNRVVLTTDGRVHSGIVIDEGSTSVTLRGANQQTKSVLRIEIEAMRDTGLSLMPEGLENSLDHQAIADLIAYLTHD